MPNDEYSKTLQLQERKVSDGIEWAGDRGGREPCKATRMATITTEGGTGVPIRGKAWEFDSFKQKSDCLIFMFLNVCDCMKLQTIIFLAFPSLPPI